MLSQIIREKGQINRILELGIDSGISVKGGVIIIASKVGCIICPVHNQLISMLKMRTSHSSKCSRNATFQTEDKPANVALHTRESVVTHVSMSFGPVGCVRITISLPVLQLLLLPPLSSPLLAKFDIA
jgi:hypothetical protein